MQLGMRECIILLFSAYLYVSPRTVTEMKTPMAADPCASCLPVRGDVTVRTSFPTRLVNPYIPNEDSEHSRLLAGMAYTQSRPVLLSYYAYQSAHDAERFRCDPAGMKQ